MELELAIHIKNLQTSFMEHRELAFELASKNGICTLENWGYLPVINPGYFSCKMVK